MTLSRETIFENIREVLEEALGADAEDITPDATLTGDLEAESIDFLDIVFRLEKKFSTPGKPFKINQGELFPENLMENPAWVSNGKFTDAARRFYAVRKRPRREQGRRADHGEKPGGLRGAETEGIKPLAA